MKLLVERTQHGQERNEERGVDEEKVIKNAKEIYQQPDGSKVFVNGNKVVIVTPSGKVRSSWADQTKAETAKKVKSGYWKPIKK